MGAGLGAAIGQGLMGSINMKREDEDRAAVNRLRGLQSDTFELQLKRQQSALAAYIDSASGFEPPPMMAETIFGHVKAVHNASDFGVFDNDPKPSESGLLQAPMTSTFADVSAMPGQVSGAAVPAEKSALGPGGDYKPRASSDKNPNLPQAQPKGLMATAPVAGQTIQATAAKAKKHPLADYVNPDQMKESLSKYDLAYKNFMAAKDKIAGQYAPGEWQYNAALSGYAEQLHEARAEVAQNTKGLQAAYLAGAINMTRGYIMGSDFSKAADVIQERYGDAGAPLATAIRSSKWLKDGQLQLGANGPVISKAEVEVYFNPNTTPEDRIKVLMDADKNRAHVAGSRAANPSDKLPAAEIQKDDRRASIQRGIDAATERLGKAKDADKPAIQKSIDRLTERLANLDGGSVRDDKKERTKAELKPESEATKKKALNLMGKGDKFSSTDYAALEAMVKSHSLDDSTYAQVMEFLQQMDSYRPKKEKPKQGLSAVEKPVAL